jgi:hypothetical protein
MIVSATPVFLAAVAFIVLLYVWTIHVTAARYREVFIKLLAAEMLKTRAVENGLQIALHYAKKYADTVGDIEGVDFLTEKNFSPEDLRILKIVLGRTSI